MQQRPDADAAIEDAEDATEDAAVKAEEDATKDTDAVEDVGATEAAAEDAD